MERERVIQCSGAGANKWGDEGVAVRPRLESGERQ